MKILNNVSETYLNLIFTANFIFDAHVYLTLQWHSEKFFFFLRNNNVWTLTKFLKPGKNRNYPDVWFFFFCVIFLLIVQANMYTARIIQTVFIFKVIFPFFFSIFCFSCPLMITKKYPEYCFIITIILNSFFFLSFL